MSHSGNCYQKRKKGFHQDDEIVIDFENRGLMIRVKDHRNKHFNEFHIPVQEVLEMIGAVKHYTLKNGVQWEIIS